MPPVFLPLSRSLSLSVGLPWKFGWRFLTRNSAGWTQSKSHRKQSFTAYPGLRFRDQIQFNLLSHDYFIKRGILHYPWTIFGYLWAWFNQTLYKETFMIIIRTKLLPFITRFGWIFLSFYQSQFYYISKWQDIHREMHLGIKSFLCLLLFEHYLFYRRHKHRDIFPIREGKKRMYTTTKCWSTDICIISTTCKMSYQAWTWIYTLWHGVHTTQAGGQTHPRIRV